MAAVATPSQERQEGKACVKDGCAARCQRVTPEERPCDDSV